MKTSLVLGTAVAALLVTGAASAAKTTYTATLSGAAEVPAVETQATGTATLTFDDQTKKLCGKITHTLAAAANAAHLHAGAPGESGAPFVDFADVASPMNVAITLDDGQITRLVTGQFYVNVHTAAHPAGEIRGDMATGGAEQTCDDDAPPDAGSSGAVDSGASSSSSGGANDAGTVRSDAGSAPAAATEEDDGCSTTGSAPGSGTALAFAVGIAVAAIGRSRRKR